MIYRYTLIKNTAFIYPGLESLEDLALSHIRKLTQALEHLRKNHVK